MMDIITITVEDSANTEMVMQAMQEGFHQDQRVLDLLGNGVTITLQPGKVVASGSLDDVIAQLDKITGK